MASNERGNVFDSGCAALHFPHPKCLGLGPGPFKVSSPSSGGLGLGYLSAFSPVCCTGTGPENLEKKFKIRGGQRALKAFRK